MGINVELKKGNFENLVNELQKKCGTEDKEFITKVLEQFGEHAGDYYFILNNEFWEDNNSYYSLSGFLDRYYGIEDSFDVLLQHLEEANANWNEDEVADALGVELPEVEEEY